MCTVEFVILKASGSNDAEAATSSAASSAPPPASASVELHPRKRKMKQNKEPAPSQPAHDAPEPPTLSEVHPHEQPITNCYQLFLNIRKQVRKKYLHFIHTLMYVFSSGLHQYKLA